MRRGADIIITTSSHICSVKQSDISNINILILGFVNYNYSKIFVDPGTGDQLPAGEPGHNGRILK